MFIKSKTLLPAAAIVIIALVAVVWVFLRSFDESQLTTPVDNNESEQAQTSPTPPAFYCQGELGKPVHTNRLFENPEATCFAVVDGPDIFTNNDISRLISIKRLDLNNMGDTFPTEITTLRTLTMLDISFNFELNALPFEVGRLENLVVLNVSNTGISSLPPSISQLSNLKSLVIHEGQLSDAQQSLLKENLPNLVISAVGPIEPPVSRN